MSTSNHDTDRVTIGKLARDADVLPSTVRYYVKEGLLQVADHTLGGFFLFDRASAPQRIERIQILKGQRLTLVEIREQLLKEAS
ncbi:MAG: MerR family transcriptional regulator [Chloroflexota bacterium]|nr:MerR family transcriptional regulator [Chloroflexota bacterium]